MSVLHLACGGSPSYLAHTAAMVHSALCHRGALDACVHYLHGPELGRAERRDFAAMITGLGAQPSLLEVDDARIAGLPGLFETPAQLWYRVYLPELLPDVERVLYLDGDAIVVDSLEPLWATDLGACSIGAVTNVFAPWDQGYPATLDLAGPYFNSGVLLMDLERWRREDSTRRILEHARANADRLPWSDQDALNVVLGGERLVLHPRWNCMNALFAFDAAVEAFGRAALDEALARPGIRHFEGPGQNKPWHYEASAESRRLYDRHRRETPWPEYAPVGRSARAVVRRYAGALRRPR